MGWLRIRLGPHEIELEGDDEFVRDHLEQFYEHAAAGTVPMETPASNGQPATPAMPETHPSAEPTPDEFFQQAGHRRDGVTTLLIFGKYLGEHRNKPEFTQADVREAAREAKLVKPIHGQYFTIAVRQGLLRKQGQYYSLTFSGAQFVADSLAAGPVDVPTGIRLAIS